MPNDAPNIPLSDDEYAALNVLLAAPELGGRAMDLSALEGFLTALAIGPNDMTPEQWLPWVLDMEQGAPDLAAIGLDAAKRIAALATRHYAHMEHWMREDPGSFEPIYDCGPEWGGAPQWCEGFLLGTELDSLDWSPLFTSAPAWFAPFMRLGTEDGRAMDAVDQDFERWPGMVAPAVVSINAFWTKLRHKQGTSAGSQTVVRDTLKVGRNDPCPCGSGKKYKKCCGAAA
jgi:uncharacterized protein